jgi:hypothetical protein
VFHRLAILLFVQGGYLIPDSPVSTLCQP